MHSMKALAIVVLSGLFLGCGAPDSDELAVDLPGASEWSFEAAAESVTAPAQSLYREMRASEHGTFDRVVYVFDETSLPNYRLGYGGQAIGCGSGEPIEVRGNYFIHANFANTVAHRDDGSPTVPTQILLQFPNVRERQLTCDFEGVVEEVVGVRRKRTFRVAALSAPTRLVVDIQH